MSSTMNQLHFGAPIVKKVAGIITGTTALTIWDPTSGKTVRFRGCALRCRVTTVLASATVGDHISICDNAAATPFVNLGVIVTATDAVATNYGFVAFDFPGGYPLAAADNNLIITTGATITTGVISIIGLVWGDEI